jgi:hypothetical protein
MINFNPASHTAGLKGFMHGAFLDWIYLSQWLWLRQPHGCQLCGE